jgi:putative transposase
MDFLHDQLFDGRKIRILAVIDLFSRFSPALDPRFSYKAQNVVETLDRATAVTGYPRTIRVDNGPEFVSRDLDLWAFQHGVTLDFSRPGKPTDNAFAESFNGKVRAECLNTAWFLSLDDARRKCETWRRDYNEERPHSSIGDKCPIELMNGRHKHLLRRNVRSPPEDLISSDPDGLYGGPPHTTCLARGTWRRSSDHGAALKPAAG